MAETHEKPKKLVKIHRQSVGIACVRIIDNEPQILMINKRYTYAYSEFVHGKYPSDRAYVMNLLNKMTNQEKILLLSLNFDMIWYHIWLNAPKPHTFYFAKNRFETTYLLDSGIRLKNMIAKSKTNLPIWEIPKGRKRNKNETDICCAIREFKEETGIDKKSYYLYSNAKKTYSYEDNGIRYVNTYYMAHTRNIFDPKISLYVTDQIDEICDIRWMGINDIRLIDTDHRLETMIQHIFKFIKKRVKDIDNFCA
jgi:8-oxo-dGTP pyrophosphatase MutT (NUDIX family)